jgi:hypothetical protein
MRFGDNSPPTHETSVRRLPLPVSGTAVGVRIKRQVVVFDAADLAAAHEEVVALGAKLLRPADDLDAVEGSRSTPTRRATRSASAGAEIQPARYGPRRIAAGRTRRTP